MKQFEITKKGNLLDQQGRVAQSGYAKHLILQYNRQMVKASKFRIKEWDYYFIGNKDFGVTMTIADNSYMGLAGVEFFDFTNQKQLDFQKISLFPMGKMNLPNDSKTGDITYQHRKIQMSMESHETHKGLFCRIPNIDGGQTFELDVKLYYRNQDSMVIATPFADDEKAFYYNQKVNNLEAEGMLKIGEEKYDLTNMLGVLDWGRGVWTYNNTWYWSSASGRLGDGTLFGFNLGYGFGDTSKASENMVFYKGKAYKLNDVDFGIPASDYMDPWHFTSRDKAIDMTFEPIYLNHSDINVGVLRHHPNQIFGLYSGYIEINGGEKIKVNEIFGFAEKVHNKW
ncbi:DUF2804 domain-containing protein [Oceanobacillus bengalensis]|nr:DUF2804 domain-containing protein [Oceanobacillus bengalensis]